MKTDVAYTSVEAYYEAVVSTDMERSQAEEVLRYILEHYPCTRRQVAAHFKRLNPDHKLGQEARVSARVRHLLKDVKINGQSVLLEDTKTEFTDPVTHQKATLLYPGGVVKTRELFQRALL